MLAARRGRRLGAALKSCISATSSGFAPGARPTWTTSRFGRPFKNRRSPDVDHCRSQGCAYSRLRPPAGRHGRTLLDYVKKNDEQRYKTLIERLGIRR
jgi:hypothetical protein